MLATLGAVVTIGLGLFGAIWPHRAAAFVGISPLGGLGVSEIRATYGGLFIA
ncbi:MAG: putative rane protein, partial [Pseudomonadota bacterium]